MFTLSVSFFVFVFSHVQFGMIGHYGVNVVGRAVEEGHHVSGHA